MNIYPIHTEADLEKAFARMEALWNAEAGTSEADELEVLPILIEKYEDEHYPIGPSDPIEASKFKMEQQGLVARDLEPFIGSSGRVSGNGTRREAVRVLGAIPKYMLINVVDSG